MRYQIICEACPSKGSQGSVERLCYSFISGGAVISWTRLSRDWEPGKKHFWRIVPHQNPTQKVFAIKALSEGLRNQEPPDGFRQSDSASKNGPGGQLHCPNHRSRMGGEMDGKSVSNEEIATGHRGRSFGDSFTPPIQKRMSILRRFWFCYLFCIVTSRRMFYINGNILVPL